MQTNNSNEESKDDNFVGRGKPHAFSVINAVRDMCEQPDGIKVLLFTLATYCDRDGVCFPSNRTLTQATGKSERSIRRMLRQLASEGELEVLAPGIGRDQKRVLRLTRYVVRENGQSCGPFKPATLSWESDRGTATWNNHQQPRETYTRARRVECE
jgi:hypothetical protein